MNSESNEKVTSQDKMHTDACRRKVRAKIWLVSANDDYIGHGRIELLENIVKVGSISRAAKEMNMSYKKSWKLIEGLNSMFEQPLVIKEKGGKQGGGAVVTERGLQVIKEFRRLELELMEFLATRKIDI